MFAQSQFDEFFHGPPSIQQRRFEIVPHGLIFVSWKSTIAACHKLKRLGPMHQVQVKIPLWVLFRRGVRVIELQFGDGLSTCGFDVFWPVVAVPQFGSDEDLLST